MKQTDILTGRIAQRVYETMRKKEVSESLIRHGISNQYDIRRLVDNLFELFPDSKIKLQKLPFGYELTIHVVRKRKENNNEI